MPTILEADAEGEDETSQRMAAVARQNVQAQAEPVSSVTWTHVLNDLARKQGGLPLAVAIKKYLNTVDVATARADAPAEKRQRLEFGEGDVGENTLGVDRQKMTNIRYLYERTCPEAYYPNAQF